MSDSRTRRIIGLALALALAGLPTTWMLSATARVAVYRSALMVGGRDLRTRALTRLIAEGPPAISALGLAAQDPDRALRGRAAAALADIGPAALAELFSLVDFHPCVRQAAHSIVREDEPAALEEALPLLIRGPSPVRERILVALAEIYGRGDVSIPLDPDRVLAAVGPCLDDPDPEVRTRALRFGSDLASIEKRGELWGRHLPRFVAEVRGARSRRLRLAAVRAIGLLGERGAPALAVLEGLLEDDDPKARARAIIALRMIGDPARPLLPKIAAMLVDPCPSVRVDATHALFFLKAIEHERYRELCERLTRSDPDSSYDPIPGGELYKAARLSADELEGLLRADPELGQILGPALRALLELPSRRAPGP